MYRELVAFDQCSSMVVEGLALALVGIAARDGHSSTRGAPRWMSQAEEYLRSNFTRSVRVHSVAESVNVPPALLSRWFRRRHGCTIGEFVRELRVEHAARLLSSSRMPITAVALASGFVDHAHLTRTFRRLRQLTPSEFRARMSA
jgi:AraC family transcriptional regulator